MRGVGGVMNTTSATFSACTLATLSNISRKMRQNSDLRTHASPAFQRRAMLTGG